MKEVLISNFRIDDERRICCTLYAFLWLSISVITPHCHHHHHHHHCHRRHSCHCYCLHFQQRLGPQSVPALNASSVYYTSVAIGNVVQSIDSKLFFLHYFKTYPVTFFSSHLNNIPRVLLISFSKLYIVQISGGKWTNYEFNSAWMLQVTNHIFVTPLKRFLLSEYSTKFDYTDMSV